MELDWLGGQIRLTNRPQSGRSGKNNEDHTADDLVARFWQTEENWRKGSVDYTGTPLKGEGEWGKHNFLFLTTCSIF